MSNFTISRMRTQRNNRSATADDSSSQAQGMANAKAWQDSEHAKVFAGVSGPGPSESTLSSANSSPRSAMSTTSIEQVRRAAQLQEANTSNQLGQFNLRDVR
jgi:hypothetical protein